MSEEKKVMEFNFKCGCFIRCYIRESDGEIGAGFSCCTEHEHAYAKPEEFYLAPHRLKQVEEENAKLKAEVMEDCKDGEEINRLKAEIKSLESRLAISENARENTARFRSAAAKRIEELESRLTRVVEENKKFDLVKDGLKIIMEKSDAGTYAYAMAKELSEHLMAGCD